MRDIVMDGVAHTNRSFRDCQKYDRPPPSCGVSSRIALLFVSGGPYVLIFRRLGWAGCSEKLKGIQCHTPDSKALVAYRL
jgi:hypothetical protein